MPIRTSKTTVTIEGACTVEDALVLLAQSALFAHGFTREQLLEARVLDTLL